MLTSFHGDKSKTVPLWGDIFSGLWSFSYFTIPTIQSFEDNIFLIGCAKADRIRIEKKCNAYLLHFYLVIN